jgi:hypothetical protein
MFRSLIESIREAVLTPWANKPSKKTLKDIEKRLRSGGMTTKKYDSGDEKARIPFVPHRSADTEKPTTKSYTWRDAGKDKKFGS